MPDATEVLKRTLTDLFTGAIGADLVVSAAEARKAGIPSRWAATVARRSHGINGASDVAEAADDFAVRIAKEMAAVDTTDPIELAKNLPRY